MTTEARVAATTPGNAESVEREEGRRKEGSEGGHLVKPHGTA